MLTIIMELDEKLKNQKSCSISFSRDSCRRIMLKTTNVKLVVAQEEKPEDQPLTWLKEFRAVQK